MAGYNPPALNRQIVVRNPHSGTAERDAFGRVIGESTHSQQWTVWAHRMDLSPQDSYEEGVTVELLRSRFTIRYRGDLAPNVQIVDSGVLFESVGPPVERGVRGVGASHLQIIAERRA